MEPSLSVVDCRDTVTSVRRPAVPILIALLMLAGALLPATASAHSGRSGVASAAVTATDASPPVALIGVRPAPPSLALVLVALAAAALLAMARPGWRRAIGVTLVILLAMLAVEQSVHSVHHLAAPTPTACVVAAAAGHLLAVDDGGAPTLPAPVIAPRPRTEVAPSRPLGVEVGRDPARAPPFVIA